MVMQELSADDILGEEDKELVLNLLVWKTLENDQMRSSCEPRNRLAIAASDVDDVSVDEGQPI